MTDSPLYDGVGKLGDAISALYGCSPKNNNRIAELVSAAKADLGITTKAKVLPDDVKLAIWRWHFDRLQAVKIVSQPVQSEAVELYSQADSNESVELYSQSTDSESVELYSQSTDSESVELYSQSNHNDTVEIISHPTSDDDVNIVSQPATVSPVEIISQSDSNDTVEIVSQPGQSEAVEIISQYDINALVRIAFYTINKGVKTRQVIALEGFMVNALMLATGITKQDVPKWIQDAVNNWGAFDSALPVTKQVKFLIIREITAQLERFKHA